MIDDCKCNQILNEIQTRFGPKPLFLNSSVNTDLDTLIALLSNGELQIGSLEEEEEEDKIIEIFKGVCISLVNLKIEKNGRGTYLKNSQDQVLCSVANIVEKRIGWFHFRKIKRKNAKRQKKKEKKESSSVA